MNSQDLINLQESYLDVYEAYGELPKRKISGKLIRTAAKGGAKIATAVGIYGGESAVGELGDAPEELAGRFVEGGIKDLSRARRMRQTMRTHSPEAAQRKEQENRNRPPGQRRSRPVGFGEDYEFYDLVLSHLLDEGYADCLGSAEIILENMSDEWLDDIIEAFVDPETGKAPSGRSPIENVSYHPKKSVRRKAMIAFARQMEKEYGGKWRAKTKDPTKD